MSSVRFDQCPTGSVRLESVIRDPESVSPRVGLDGRRVDADRVAEFKQMLLEDLQALPTPICAEDHGVLILADGHHRMAALEQLAREYPGDRRFQFVTVRVVNTPSDQTPLAYAFEIALECSAKGPLPLTRAEKQAAIARLVAGHPDWSDREIARRAGVDHKTVGNLRMRGISPAADSPLHNQHGAAAATSSTRLARIAAQISRYGVELGAEGSEVGYDEIVAELADRFRARHPGTARDWSEWWESIWRDVRRALETDD